jgi:membrane fusion protein (multidrug efflux system)
MSDEIKRKKKKRNNILFVLIMIFVVIGISYTVYYKTYSQFYETTDNAYVKQNITYVTPQIYGVVDIVNIDVTQSVKVGDILAHIDSKDAELAFKKAKNDLAQSVRQIKKSYKQKDEIKSEIRLYKILVEKAKKDFDRNKVLTKNKVISQEKFDNSKYAYEEAKENLQIAKNKYLSLVAMINDKMITQNPQIKKAVLGVEQSYINLKRCDILAPTNGVIAKKNLSVGSNVAPSSMLLAIVPQNGFWVDANFKETQLENIRLGQSVKLYSDLYGKDVEYNGKVEGISPGTGSVFSLLPAQNATGNWIKVVQRVPVRIKLDQKELQKHPLHVGNSMEVVVNTHNRNSKRLQNLKKPRYSSNLYSTALSDARKIAKRIIKQNL